MAVVRPAGLKAHQDPPGEGLQHLGGKARHHVGLVDRRGDARLGGGLHHGKGGIAPGADDGIGPEFPEDGSGLPGGPHQVIDGDEVVADLPGRKGAVETGNMDGPEFIPGLGHKILLQSPVGTHEKDLRPGFLPPQQLGQGNRRVHMPRRAAAGEDDALQFSAHGAFRLSKCRYPDFPGFICRETDSTTPISTSWMQRAVPP